MSDLALEAKGLFKRYGGIRVTNDVSLTLSRGARHALIGPNGAGKSTLVGLLSGTNSPNAGTISLFGRDVTQAGAAARTKLGLVRTFQITSLFPGLSLLENLYVAVSERRGESCNLWRPALARRNTIEEAERLLEQFRLAPFAGKPIFSLAYGQQRLVEIAVALALKPKALLLDEPAAGIPTSELDLLVDAINGLPPDISILMIEHDIALVREFASEITLLVEGRVAASGSPGDILGSQLARDVYLGAKPDGAALA